MLKLKPSRRFQVSNTYCIDPSIFCPCDRKQELCFTNDVSQRRGCVQQVLGNDFANTNTNSNAKCIYKYKYRQKYKYKCVPNVWMCAPSPWEWFCTTGDTGLQCLKHRLYKSYVKNLNWQILKLYFNELNISFTSFMWRLYSVHKYLHLLQWWLCLEYLNHCGVHCKCRK